MTGNKKSFKRYPSPESVSVEGYRVQKRRMLRKIKDKEQDLQVYKAKVSRLWAKLTKTRQLLDRERAKLEQIKGILTEDISSEEEDPETLPDYYSLEGTGPSEPTDKDSP